MPMLSFWKKLTSKKKSRDDKRRNSRESDHNCDNDTVASSVARDDVSVRRKRALSNQILKISGDSFSQGDRFLELNKFDEARERFEDALAARLVLYGPDNERVIKVHQKLKEIAEIQGDAAKAAHHRLKILQYMSLKNAYRQSEHDPVDWSILSAGD